MQPRADQPAGAGLEPAPAPDLTFPTPWQTATVERVTVETYRARTFTLRLAEPRPFRAGQHYDIRLTAPDGYQAQRSYSVATPPEETNRIDLTVELIPDGEVSPYFHEVVQPGDELEVRGPIGGPFTWGAELGGPLLLLAGGSGIVPIRSMLAHREAVAPNLPALLLYSARSAEDIIYRKWLSDTMERCPAVTVRYALTRRQPPGWRGYARRVDAAMLCDCIAELSQRRSAGDGVSDAPLCYACGPTGFVETAADALLAVGARATNIRTERFGPTA